MSGGLDSTAAALLLKEQGYSIVGCTFRTRYTKESSLQAARDLATKLGIEHHIVDFTQQFDDTVIAYFRSEYMEGRTPNPCVLCNRVIKFGELLKVADQLGCDKIATGHYARIQDGFICRAADTKKDQTYFLWQLSPEQLGRVVFPLGDMTKVQVRAYLKENGYTTLAEGAESQDICFIEDDYRSFLQLPPNPGSYVLSSPLNCRCNAPSSKLSTMAKHEGFAHYTIGQRKGLGIALGTPAFVTKIDAEKNEVTLGTHDELYTHEVHLRDVIFRGDPTQPVMAQIRYRSQPQLATINFPLSTIRFEEAVWAVTPGQSCVFYQGNRLVGGGIIQ